jgi:hypothetical protein
LFQKILKIIGTFYFGKLLAGMRICGKNNEMRTSAKNQLGGLEGFHGDLKLYPGA